MWTCEVLPPIIDIVNYLIPLWHVSQTSSLFAKTILFTLTFGSCLCWTFLVRLSPNMFAYIFLGNRLLQATLCSCFAWPREYLKLSRTSIYLNMAFKSYHLPYAYLLWNWSSISFLYTTEKYLYILLVLDKWYSYVWWNL